MSPTLLWLLLVLLIEKPAGDYHQVAHGAVFGVSAEDCDVAFLSVADGHSLVQHHHRRGGDDARNLLLHGFHVVDGQRVRRGVGNALRSALVLGVDQVRADALNQVQHILLSGQADGHDQNERGGANHHAQAGERKTHLVAAESVVGEADDLAEVELRAADPTLRWLPA